MLDAADRIQVEEGYLKLATVVMLSVTINLPEISPAWLLLEWLVLKGVLEAGSRLYSSLIFCYSYFAFTETSLGE